MRERERDNGVKRQRKRELISICLLYRRHSKKKNESGKTGHRLIDMEREKRKKKQSQKDKERKNNSLGNGRLGVKATTIKSKRK